MGDKIKGYKFVASSGENAPAKVYIYGVIGWDVTPKDVARDIDSIADESVEIHINSVGGDCMAGAAIFNAIKGFNGTKTAIIDGMAGSAASYIMLACDSIRAYGNASVFIHNPQSSFGGDAAKIEKIAKSLRKIEAQYVEQYVKRTGKSEEEIRAVMDAETLFTAQEAKDFGLVDEVISDDADAERANAKNYFRMVAQFDYSKPFATAGRHKQSTQTKVTKMTIKDKDGLKSALESLKELEGDELKSKIDEINSAIEALEIKESKQDDSAAEAMGKEQIQALIDSAVASVKAEYDDKLEKTESEYNKKLNNFLGQGFNGGSKNEPKAELKGVAAASAAWNKKFIKK